MTNEERTGLVRREEFGGTEIQNNNEMQRSASAEEARAMIESQFTVAKRFPRNMMNVRARLLKDCDRPRFAEAAEYKLPRKKKNDDGTKEDIQIRGLSIKFAEAAIPALGNLDVSSVILVEDADSRVGRVTVLDLETNARVSETFVVKKTVERSDPWDSEAILGRRLNSRGAEVFIVAAREADVNMKTRSEIQKAKRNAILAMIPADIREECIEKCQAVVKAGIKDDPTAYMKKLLDGFSIIGVLPSQIDEYLGHSVDTVTPDEILDLKDIFGEMRDGESTWADVMERGQKTESKPLTDQEKKERVEILKLAATTNVARPQVYAEAMKAVKLPPTTRADAMSFPLLKKFGGALNAAIAAADAAVPANGNGATATPAPTQQPATDPKAAKKDGK